MPSDRRDFLRLSAAAGGALGLGITSSLIGATSTPAGRAPLRGEQERTGAPLRILILGGTGFIGPFQVRYALGRGHAVTLFNRGRTNAGLFPDVETLIGEDTVNIKQ